MARYAFTAMDFHHLLLAGLAGAPLPPIPPTQDDSLPVELFEHVHRLRLILSVISISVMALHRQDAELDADIASVLRHHACVPLDDEIERIESILASLTWQHRQQEAHA